MKRFVGAVAASVTLLAVAAAPAAQAAAMPSFTATSVGDLTMRFDASASVCEFGGCSFGWRWFNGTRLGVTMGSGVILTFRFPSPGSKTVVLKASQHCAPNSVRFCARTLAKQVFVPDPGPAAPPPGPPAPPPPPVTPPAAPGLLDGLPLISDLPLLEQLLAVLAPAPPG